MNDKHECLKALVLSMLFILDTEPEQALIVLRTVVNTMEQAHQLKAWVDDGWCDHV